MRDLKEVTIEYGRNGFEVSDEGGMDVESRVLGWSCTRRFYLHIWVSLGVEVPEVGTQCVMLGTLVPKRTSVTVLNRAV